MMAFIPRYSGGSGAVNVSPVVCTSSITIGILLISSCMEYSWPAIVFWIIAGLMFLIRCDRWCCLCLDGPPREHLLDNMAPTATRSQKFHSNSNQRISANLQQEGIRWHELSSEDEYLDNGNDSWTEWHVQYFRDRENKLVVLLYLWTSRWHCFKIKRLNYFHWFVCFYL